MAGDTNGKVRPGSSRRGWIGLLTGLTGFGLGMLVLVLIVAAALTGVVDGCTFGDIGGPGKGDDSEELDVDVAPAEGLADGDTVFVSSRAFRPHGIVGVAVCLEEALTEEQGVDACDTDGGQRFAVSAEGDLAAVVAVPRVITVAGEAHDCAERAGRCLVVAADSRDFDLSGGRPVTFAPDPDPPDLEPAGERPRTVMLPGSVEPAGPVEAGATVTVSASGFMPGEPVIVGQCTEAFPRVEVWEACEPAGDDPGATIAAIVLRSVEQVTDHADAEGRVELEVPVEATVLVGRVSSGDEEEDGASADCTGEPGACALVVAAAADTQRSAYLPLTVTG